jgi:hypothetical protein
MFRSVATFLALALVVIGTLAHEPSALYKKYQASAGKQAPLKSYDVESPVGRELKSQQQNEFYPPLPGQTGRDYHPIKKPMDGNDTQIIYYSWHLHVYFFHEDQNVTDRTLALRDNFMKRFSLATCDDSCFMGGPFDNCTQGESLFLLFMLFLFCLLI